MAKKKKIPDSYIDEMLSGEKRATKPGERQPSPAGQGTGKKKASKRTIYFDDDLWIELKIYSARTGKSITSILEELAREKLKSK